MDVMRHSNRMLIDLDALPALFRHRVALAAELIHLGLSSAAVHGRCGRGGPWHRLLPGVLLLANGPPSRLQLVEGALRYAGRGALLTGLDALHLHGMHAVPATGPVHVLVPHGSTVGQSPRIRVSGTRTLPDPVLRKGFLVVPLVRAALDAARSLPSGAGVHTLLTDVVRLGGVDPDDVRTELRRGGAKGAAVIREVVAGIQADLFPAPDALARSVLRGAGLPPPRWRVSLCSAEGRALGTADAWWGDLALAWQFATPPAATPPAATPGLGAVGIVVVHTAPGRLRQEPSAVVDELLRGVDLAGRRPRPAVRVGQRRVLGGDAVLRRNRTA